MSLGKKLGVGLLTLIAGTGLLAKDKADIREYPYNYGIQHKVLEEVIDTYQLSDLKDNVDQVKQFDLSDEYGTYLNKVETYVTDFADVLSEKDLTVGQEYKSSVTVIEQDGSSKENYIMSAEKDSTGAITYLINHNEILEDESVRKTQIEGKSIDGKVSLATPAQRIVGEDAQGDYVIELIGNQMRGQITISQKDQEALFQYGGYGGKPACEVNGKKIPYKF
jgi:hypothetical protein